MSDAYKFARQPSLVKAPRLMSSSVYRALRSAGYTDSGIIDFATSLLAGLCEDREAFATERSPLDAQTGLPVGDVLREILDFEIERARSHQHPAVGVLVVAVHPRPLCTATERFRDESRVVGLLQARMRRGDAVGRTDAREFVLVLPGADTRATESMARDVDRDVRNAALSRDTQWQVHHASLAPSMKDAAALLDSARTSSAATQVVATATRPTPGTDDGRLALALCGGGAMAAAHIGALWALHDHGATISGIGATSAGALVAAMYGCGLGHDAMLERFVSLRCSDVYAHIRQAYADSRARLNAQGPMVARARLGLATTQEVSVVGDSVLRALVQHFVPHDRPIESMPVRLAFCATDLRAGRTTYLSHGSLHDALMAACAAPGLFPPQRLGTRLLVDGSLAGELPVAAATSIADGAPVIGCYLDGPSVAPRSFSNGLAVAARVAAVRQRELVCEQTRTCEAVLRVPVSHVGWLGFGRCEDAERAGREAVAAYLGRKTAPSEATTAGESSLSERNPRSCPTLQLPSDMNAYRRDP